MIYLGSKMKYRGQYVIISMISKDGFFNIIGPDIDEVVCVSELEPIPLKEEDLVELGFTYTPTGTSGGSAWTGWWIKGGIELGVSSSSPEVKFPVYAYISDMTIELKWLHQLQTLIELGEHFDKI